MMLFSSVLLISIPAIEVNAETTEDLLNVYGLTLGGPVKSEIEKHIEALEWDLTSMQTQEDIAKQYNDVLVIYYEERDKRIDNVLNDVNAYQKRNADICSSINDEILTADIDSLLRLDSQYKTNTKYMNELLSSINEYKLDYAYRSISTNTSAIENELEQANQLYIESIDAFDLGKVKNIGFVLDNDRHINSPYGYRVDPIDTEHIRFHSGTDYRAVEGTPIHALFNGVVIDCGWSNSIGNYVTVQSGDNVKYLICHCSGLNVVKDQQVMQGDILGYVGGTGTRCTGPHLHLALYLNGVTYDVDRLFK